MSLYLSLSILYFRLFRVSGMRRLSAISERVPRSHVALAAARLVVCVVVTEIVTGALAALAALELIRLTCVGCFLRYTVDAGNTLYIFLSECVATGLSYACARKLLQMPCIYRLYHCTLYALVFF